MEVGNGRLHGLAQIVSRIVRLAGALLLEQNDEWAVQQSRYMTLETIATMSDYTLISLPAAS